MIEARDCTTCGKAIKRDEFGWFHQETGDESCPGSESPSCTLRDVVENVTPIRVPTMSLEAEMVVAFIMREPRMLHRLLAEHVDDGGGHCKVCASAGAHYVWPCRIRGYANLTLRVLRRQTIAASRARRRHAIP